MTILTRRSTLQQLQKKTTNKPYIIPELKELSIETDWSELENEILDILPSFESADYDWKCFGYLLDANNNKPTTSGESECENQVVRFVKPEVEPIGKGRRRRRSFGAKAPKTNSDSVNTNVRKEVINPADITLGGDTFDYSKEETKKEEEEVPEDESIATGVARRRRTSTTLSKSEDDEAVPRPNKERRLSESQLEKVDEPEEQVQKQEHQPIPKMVEIDRNALHCVCQTLYDDTKFYVMCDLCCGWFHGECVDVTEKRAAKMDGWTCEQCMEEEQRIKDAPQLYCLCRTPYDDTKFYVGCDSCQGWFHPECVSITRKAAEEAADYICPGCKAENDEKGYESSSSSEGSMISRASTNLMQSDYTYVMQLLELLLEHRMSSPFRRPVSLDDFPDYNQFIKYPMDLSTIGQRVERLEYLHLSDFVADVNLMFENAKKYNPKDHAIFKCAETMQEVFEKKLLEARDAIKMNHIQSMSRRRLISEGQNTLDGSLDIETDQLIQFVPSSELQMYDY